MLDFLELDLLASCFVNKVSSLVTRCYKPAIFWTILTTWAEFCLIQKDVLCIFQQRHLIYKLQCCCNATYIGRTSQSLEVRVKQLVPRYIRNHTTPGHSKLLYSAICEHLNALNRCVVDYSDGCFEALHRTWTRQHLLHRPSLCKQNPKQSRNLLG